MQRKAVKLVGLVLIGAAAFAAVRRWLHRSDDGPSDPPFDPSPLVPVPDLEAGPAPEPEADPGPEPEPGPEAGAEPEPGREPEPGSGSEPESDSEPAGDAAPAWRLPVAGGCPPGYPIKVNERSGIYHVPGGLSYERTSPTRCYADEASAQADGFRRAKR